MTALDAPVARGRDHHECCPRGARERRRSAIGIRSRPEERHAHAVLLALGHLIDRHRDDVARGEEPFGLGKRAARRDEREPAFAAETHAECIEHADGLGLHHHREPLAVLGEHTCRAVRDELPVSRMRRREDDGAALGRGWSDYLTCYGREVNVDSTGATRIDLNTVDLVELAGLLTPVVGQELSDYIVYTRATNKAVAAAPLTASQVAAPAGSLRDLVQTLLDKKAQGTRKLSSTMTLYGTQIPLPPPPSPPGRPPNPAPVVTSPLNDPARLAQLLPLLLDKTSASTGYELSPRVNVNSAPREVLLALPGLLDADADAMIAARSALTPTDPTTLTGAWIVTQAKLPADKFKNIEKYIGGRTYTYRVHSVGYSGAPSGPASRVEAVIDVALGTPRILYYRDLTDLGRGFTNANLPR